MVIEKSIACKIIFDRFQVNGEEVYFVVHIPGVGRVHFRVRSGETFKGVGNEDSAVCNMVSSEKTTHEDTCTTAPSPGFDEIAGNGVLEHGLHTILEVIESAKANHRVGISAPYTAFIAVLAGERRNSSKAQTEKTYKFR